jgi:hypothetical protein
MIGTNPASWQKNKRDEIAALCGPTAEEKILHAVEGAAQLLQLVQMGQQINQDELRLVQRQLRSARVELLKE